MIAFLSEEDRIRYNSLNIVVNRGGFGAVLHIGRGRYKCSPSGYAYAHNYNFCFSLVSWWRPVVKYVRW